MTFSLTILGNSSALPTSKRFPTAHVQKVNEQLFLIDCGEGTQMQIRRYKLRLAKINNEWHWKPKRSELEVLREKSDPERLILV